jgi:hypothetical protein
MSAPVNGVARLMQFVDTRLEQLRMTKQEAAGRGFPNPSTLAKVRDNDVQNTPTVRTLLRIDRALGWQSGSAAVILLGGFPLTVTARTSKGVRASEMAANPVTGQEVVNRLLDQLGDEIARTRKDLTALGDRLDRLCTVHSRLVDEFRVDTKLLRDFDDGA